MKKCISKDVYSFLLARSYVLNKVYERYFGVQFSDEGVDDVVFGFLEKKPLDKIADYDVKFMDYLEEEGIIKPDLTNVLDVIEDFKEYVTIDDVQKYASYKKLGTFEKGMFRKVLAKKFGISNTEMLEYMVFKKSMVYECLYAVQG